MPGEAREALVRRFRSVRSEIAEAARRAGRDPGEVRLLAVSKRHGADAIRALYEEVGHRDFGESYAQELLDKRAQLADLPELRLHMIGHLQRNKVKSLALLVDGVQSVDSVRLALELGRRCAGRPHPLEVLVQVNLAGEEQKSGCSEAELSRVLEAARSQPSLCVRGLMMIAPRVDSEAQRRAPFEALAALRDTLGGRERLPELSMGMSGDLRVAIEAGSTCVRVGTAIFGARG